jgi:hypothetical protein
MSEQLLYLSDSQRIVFADANVLYSRVLRDYLLYSATEEVITVVWSRAVLDEIAEHLSKNILGFTHEAAERLLTNMTSFFSVIEEIERSRHQLRQH